MRRGSRAGLPAFLASEFPPAPAEKARFHVLAAPLEATVSWEGGTSRGPRAVLEASRQLEAWDGTGEPGRAGIWTCPEPVCPVRPPSVESALDAVASAVSDALDMDAVPIVIGGEHTVSVGAVRGCTGRLGAGFGVVQFDAHADLRNEYDGTRWSHACTARRILDLGVSLLQVGVRSMSFEEHRFREQNRGNISTLDAEVIARAGPEAVRDAVPPDFPETIWITFDVDVFDPSLMPATGTPEPGGLFWPEAIELLRRICRDRRLIGFDVCELAPREGLHHCEYTAARLIYFLMGQTSCPAGPEDRPAG